MEVGEDAVTLVAGFEDDTAHAEVPSEVNGPALAAFTPHLVTLDQTDVTKAPGPTLQEDVPTTVDDQRREALLEVSPPTPAALAVPHSTCDIPTMTSMNKNFQALLRNIAGTAAPLSSA